MKRRTDVQHDTYLKLFTTLATQGVIGMRDYSTSKRQTFMQHLD